MNIKDSRAYHQNRAAFFAWIATEISRQNDPSRKHEVLEYKELAHGELEAASAAATTSYIPCPF